MKKLETVFVVKANNVGYSDGSPNEKITKKNEFAITIAHKKTNFIKPFIFVIFFCCF